MSAKNTSERGAAALQRLGGRIRMARKRRELREIDLAAMAGITRHTLRRIEAGCPGTSMGAYISVMQALDLHRQLDQLADPQRDPYDGLTVEMAERIRRVHHPPDLLTYDEEENDLSYREKQELVNEMRQSRRAQRQQRRWNDDNPIAKHFR